MNDDAEHLVRPGANPGHATRVKAAQGYAPRGPRNQRRRGDSPTLLNTRKSRRFRGARKSWTQLLQAILSAHNDRHAVKPKGVSFKTREERANALFRCFRDLRALGYKIQNPQCLRGRHVQALVRDWTAAQPKSRERTLSPAMIQAELSHLRTFAEWIGKRGLVLRGESYVENPALVRRRYVAVADKGWRAHGVDPDVLIEKIAAHDPWVGAQLRVARAFGLRVKEAVMLQPHRAARPDEAGTPERYLEVMRGTKGGRLRLVPIDTDLKRAALEAARRLVGRDSAHLGHPARNLKQNLDRLHYVMTKFGVTRRALGITAHGLRHGYAADRYETLARTPAPVRGGSAPKSETDSRSRLAVAEELGHGRTQIVAAYLGSSVVMRSKVARRPPAVDADDRHST